MSVAKKKEKQAEAPVEETVAEAAEQTPEAQATDHRVLSR